MCEGLNSSYAINGVWKILICIFPSWFNFLQMNSSFDFTGQIDEPLQILSDGYALIYSGFFLE